MAQLQLRLFYLGTKVCVFFAQYIHQLFSNCKYFKNLRIIEHVIKFSDKNMIGFYMHDQPKTYGFNSIPFNVDFHFIIDSIFITAHT